MLRKVSRPSEGILPLFDKHNELVSTLAWQPHRDDRIESEDLAWQRPEQTCIDSLLSRTRRLEDLVGWVAIGSC